MQYLALEGLQGERRGRGGRACAGRSIHVLSFRIQLSSSTEPNVHHSFSHSVGTLTVSHTTVSHLVLCVEPSHSRAGARPARKIAISMAYPLSLMLSGRSRTCHITGTAHALQLHLGAFPT